MSKPPKPPSLTKTKRASQSRLSYMWMNDLVKRLDDEAGEGGRKPHLRARRWLVDMSDICDDMSKEK